MLKGAVALVTGAGQGLGRATAHRLSKMGANVVIADLSSDLAHKVVDELGGDKAMAAVLDVASEDQVQAAMKDVTDRWGAPRVLVQCAGIAPPQKTVGRKGPHRLADYEKVLNVNTVGTFNVMRLVADAMQHNEPDEHGCRGVVVNTASIAAMDGQVKIQHSSSIYTYIRLFTHSEPVC